MTYGYFCEHYYSAALSSPAPHCAKDFSVSPQLRSCPCLVCSILSWGVLLPYARVCCDPHAAVSSSTLEKVEMHHHLTMVALSLLSIKCPTATLEFQLRAITSSSLSCSNDKKPTAAKPGIRAWRGVPVARGCLCQALPEHPCRLATC